MFGIFTPTFGEMESNLTCAYLVQMGWLKPPASLNFQGWWGSLTLNEPPNQLADVSGTPNWPSQTGARTLCYLRENRVFFFLKRL